MILQRVLRGAGFKSVIFASNNGQSTHRQNEERNSHLKALSQVDQTGTLTGIELYIARLLQSRYSPSDRNLYVELDRFIKKKIEDSKSQTNQERLSNIWQRFGDVDVYGGDTDNQEDLNIPTPVLQHNI